MIQPIIVRPPHQIDKVKRLVDYCEQLDGTKVVIVDSTVPDKLFVPTYPENRISSLQAYGLHIGALLMEGRSFIWLEPDSIPLKKGWAETLTEEYEKHGKHFLLSSDKNPPCDLVGGIGVYGPDTYRLVPYQLPEHGWDMWISRNLLDWCAFTPLIQHTYGKYDQECHATMHRFPEDLGIIRKDAVIFHKDHYQGLISVLDQSL